MMDKFTLVIGGHSGIGLATVDALEDYGKSTLVPRQEDMDVRDLHSVKDYIHGVELAGYELEAIVFSAGVNYLEWLSKIVDARPLSLRDVNNVIGTNLTGFLNVMAVAASEPRDTTRPLRVIAVSSDAASRPMRTSAAYCASKAGLNAAVKVAARELGPHGWQINAVSPGMTAPTGMSEYIDKRVPQVRGWTDAEALRYEVTQEVVRGRIDPSEVAEVILSTLCGPRHLNGAIIEINGGR